MSDQRLSSAELKRKEKELDQQLQDEAIRQRLRAKRAKLALLLSGEDNVTTTSEPIYIPDPGPAGLRNDIPSLDELGPSDGSAAREPSLRPGGLPALTYHGDSYMALQTFLHDLHYHLRLYKIKEPWERIGYAVRCLKGAPKQDWISFAARQKAQGIDPFVVSLGDFEKFLHNQLSDPTTRAITAAATLAHIAQRANEPQDVKHLKVLPPRKTPSVAFFNRWKLLCPGST
ncbi:hypothetical protein F5883DRAFT_702873 [Diaporthe sp. PMI_573]|nr:hypothetical protein F5883DRAFT_702873 [Diaporthaceae sp. PMI_573]